MNKLLFFVFLTIGYTACNNSKGNYSKAGDKPEYLLKGTISNMPQAFIILACIHDYEPEIIDTIKIDKLGAFNYKFTNKSHTGIYRLMLGKDVKAQFFGGGETYLDLIFNKEDIEFSTDFIAVEEKINFTKSEENKVYFEFLKHDDKTNTQLEILSQMKEYFPEGDDFYPDIKKRYNTIQGNYFKYSDKLLSDYKDLFVSRIIKSKRYPKLDFGLTFVDKSKYMKLHYFDNVDFNDTLLMYTDVFSSKAFGYLQLYRNQQLPKDKQEKEFMKAIDFLFGRANVNEKVYKYVRNYIIKGFERIDSEPILTYIAENYTLKNTCESDKEAIKLNRRVEGFKKLSLGSKAPPLTINDLNGKKVALYDLQSEYSLVLFYASWCPHCSEMMPQLKTLYDKTDRSKIEIIAISIDSEKKSWQDFIEKGKYTWINSCDLKIWDGKAAADFYVYATPTMLLLDKNKNILAKPTSFEELKEALKKTGIN